MVEWISLGAIPAAVPHTRAVPIIGTDAGPAVCCAGRQAADRTGCCGSRPRCVSMLEMRVAEAGIPALGYFAQIPHYVSGPYPAAALELLGVLSRHLGVDLPDRGPRRGERANCGSASISRPPPTSRPERTSSGSSRWSTRPGCRPATT